MSKNKDKKYTQKKTKALIEKTVVKLKKISKKNDKVSTIFLSSDKLDGVSFVAGDSRDLEKLLAVTAKQDKGFAKILHEASNKVKSNSFTNVLDINKKSSDNVDKNVLEEFKLPDGTIAGFSMSLDEINSLTDKDIQEMIERMIDSRKGSGQS